MSVSLHQPQKMLCKIVEDQAMYQVAIHSLLIPSFSLTRDSAHSAN